MAKKLRHHESLTVPTPADLRWKVHAAGLLQEILNNEGTAILVKPLQIFMGILREIGERAAELNDPELNALMCQLAIYEVSDPKSPHFDGETVAQVFREAESAKRARRAKQGDPDEGRRKAE